jgi:hypothetical protein
MWELWITPVATIVPLIIGILVIAGYLKKIVNNNLERNAASLEAYKELKESSCSLHSAELSSLKDTTRVMLECHDTELQALEDISKGKMTNGDIAKQKDKLRQHIFEKFSG